MGVNKLRNGWIALFFSRLVDVFHLFPCTYFCFFDLSTYSYRTAIHALLSWQPVFILRYYLNQLEVVLNVSFAWFLPRLGALVVMSMVALFNVVPSFFCMVSSGLCTLPAAAKVLLECVGALETRLSGKTTVRFH